MKIVIFGSTGGTGRELIGQALDQGHHVTAQARSPEKLEDLEHPELAVVRGNVLDQADVEREIDGQEAVLCAIGAGADRTTLREDGTRVIVAAMEKLGVSRLVCLSSLGVGDSHANLPFFTKYVIVGTDLNDYGLHSVAVGFGNDFSAAVVWYKRYDNGGKPIVQKNMNETEKKQLF